MSKYVSLDHFEVQFVFIILYERWIGRSTFSFLTWLEFVHRSLSLSAMYLGVHQTTIIHAYYIISPYIDRFCPNLNKCNWVEYYPFHRTPKSLNILGKHTALATLSVWLLFSYLMFLTRQFSISYSPELSESQMYFPPANSTWSLKLNLASITALKYLLLLLDSIVESPTITFIFFNIFRPIIDAVSVLYAASN